jgi:hypothetical protein
LHLKRGSERTTNMSTKHSFHTVSPLSDGKPHLVNRGKQSGRMSVQTKIVIVMILTFFAILHAVGFTFMKRGSDGPAVEPAHLDGAD